MYTSTSLQSRFISSASVHAFMFLGIISKHVNLFLAVV